MKKDRNFAPGTEVRRTSMTEARQLVTLKVREKPCWQCGRTSVVVHPGGQVECLNDCGPEELGRLLSF